MDAETGRPFVDVVVDQAEQKGTGRWTVRIALDLGVPVSGIAEAVFARSLSGHAALRKASRGLAGPTASALSEAEAGAFADRVEQALYASKIVSYTQGFHEIAAGSEEYGWDIGLGAVSSIWRGGCIVRAAGPPVRVHSEAVPPPLRQRGRQPLGARRVVDEHGAFHTLRGGDRSEVAAQRVRVGPATRPAAARCDRAAAGFRGRRAVNTRCFGRRGPPRSPPAHPRVRRGRAGRPCAGGRYVARG